MKFFISVVIVVCALFLCITKVGAVTQETPNPIISVTETITIQNDRTAQLEFQLEIQNKSEKDLISEIKIDTGFANSNLDFSTTKKAAISEGILRLDYYTNPININSTRSEYVKFTVPNFYDDLNGMRRVYVKKLSTPANLSNYNLIVQYPAGWQSVSYASRFPVVNNIGYVTFSRNEDIYLVWGKQTVLDANAKYSITKSKDLLPLIQDNAFQESYYNLLAGADNLYFDQAGNAFITTHDGLADISSQLVINANNTDKHDAADKKLLEHQGLGLTKIDGENNTKKLEQIISTLRAKYKFTKRNELKDTAHSLQGDEYNLSLLALNWLRQTDVPSFFYIGWDLGLNKSSDRNNFSYWLVWFDGEKFVDFDIVKYVKGETDIYTSTNPDRVVVLSYIDSDSALEKLYENITLSSFQPEFSVSKNQETNSETNQDLVDININWVESDSWINRFHGVLNVRNRSRQLFNIDSFTVNNKEQSIFSEDEFEHLKKGALPGSYSALDVWHSGSILDIGKKNMQLDTQISYSLGQHNYNYNDAQTVKNLVLNSDLIRMDRIFIVFAFVVLAAAILVVMKKYLAIPFKIIRSRLSKKK